MRRWLCGLCLTSWSLHAHAAEPAKIPPAPKAPPKRQSQWVYSGERGATQISLLRETPEHAPRLRPWGWLDESTLFAARFDVDSANVISGMDVDFNLAGFANLHLLLNSDRAPADSARRWALTTGDDGALRRARKSCSLTASMDFVTIAPYGSRKLVFIPELHFALDTMLGAPRGMAAALRYSHWSAGPADKGSIDLKVPQLALNWPF